MNMMIDYPKLAEEIVKHLPKPVDLEKWWTAKECAEYLGVSEMHFRNVVSKTPEFPEPYLVPTSSKSVKEKRRPNIRWYGRKVQEYSIKLASNTSR